MLPAARVGFQRRGRRETQRYAEQTFHCTLCSTLRMRNNNDASLTNSFLRTSWFFRASPRLCVKVFRETQRYPGAIDRGVESGRGQPHSKTGPRVMERKMFRLFRRLQTKKRSGFEATAPSTSRASQKTGRDYGERSTLLLRLVPNRKPYPTFIF
jgi:hypothetical protein